MPELLKSRLFPVALAGIASAVLAGQPAVAGDINISGGSLDMTVSTGGLGLTGDRGFTFRGGVSAVGGIFRPYETCIQFAGPCGPGDVISLRALWSGKDAIGTATLDGITHVNVGGLVSHESILVEFTGTVVLPTLAPTAQVRAPFGFTGSFTHGLGIQEHLNGSGIVTLSLVDGGFPGRWRVTNTLYEFGGRLPAPWVSADVGAVATRGSASFLRDAFVVSGDGPDIWGAADAFHFMHQPLTANGAITARVVFEQRSQTFAKTGVMIRESLDASSPSVVLDVKPDGDIEFMVRYARGEPTVFVAGGVTTGLPVYLRLVRDAPNSVSALRSPDGVSWTEVGTVNVPFVSAGLLAGLAVTSHSASTLNGALIDHVELASLMPQNLLREGDFEGYQPPALGPPGWVSDRELRQIDAKSETHQPRSGQMNGACWTPAFLDCGMYPDVVAPAAGTYVLRIDASADRAGGFVGANVNGRTATSASVEVRPFGNYDEYVMTLIAAAGDVIRVWMYSPASPGYVVIDDASLSLTPNGF